MAVCPRHDYLVIAARMPDVEIGVCSRISFDPVRSHQFLLNNKNGSRGQEQCYKRLEGGVQSVEQADSQVK